jgi:hypothetical protein
MEEQKPLKNDGKFLVYINQRYYWDLNLTPSPNEFQEPINRCALVDSETKQEIDAINFDAEWFLPIFINKDNQRMKELGKQLKDITDKHKIVMTPRELMNDKRRKETKHIGKARKI